MEREISCLSPWLKVCGRDWLDSHAGDQEVDRHFTRSASQGTCTIYMPLPSVNKAVHSGFETQLRYHKKSKTGVSVAPQKELMSSNFF